MKIFARVATLFLLIILFSSAIQTKPAFAQTNQISFPNYVSAETNADVPQSLHSLTQIVTTEVFSTIICQLSGIDVIQHNQQCLGIDSQTHRIGFVNNGGGLLGLTMHGIAYTLNIPIHSSDYIGYMASNFGTQKTYAQTPNPQTVGVGYAGLQPLLNLWVTFRNIVYLLFVVIFVLIGVAIMLQVQIDPRTVMTLENQLPKIIIGLLLVTFSYAIAGFMVDVMWLLTFLSINVLTSADPVAPGLVNSVTVNVFQFPLKYLDSVFYNTAGGWGLWNLAGGGAQAIQAVIQGMLSSNSLQQMHIGAPTGAAGCTGFDPACWLGTFGNWAANTLNSILIGLLQIVLGLLAFLVILIALLITMFRIWFMLLRAYIHIILEVILAPFYIMMGLIPGSSIGFGSWFRSMAANLLTFPVTVAMFVLARVLIDSFFPNGTNYAPGSSLFVPPLIGNPNGTALGGVTVNPMGAFIALGVLFAIPEILNSIRNGLQAPGIGLGSAAFGGAMLGARTHGRVGSGLAGMLTAPTGVRYEPGGPGGTARMVPDNGPMHHIRNFVTGLRQG